MEETYKVLINARDEINVAYEENRLRILYNPLLTDSDREIVLKMLAEEYQSVIDELERYILPLQEKLHR